MLNYNQKWHILELNMIHELAVQCVKNSSGAANMILSTIMGMVVLKWHGHSQVLFSCLIFKSEAVKHYNE